MHIIEYNNYEVVPTEEAFLIKPIRDLFNADRSRTKEKFLQQMSILYFLADPRSSYNYILDEKERLQEIIKQEGLPTNFKIDGKLQEAIEIYGKHVTTSSSLLLQDLRELLEKMRKSLKSIDFDEAEDLKEKVTAIKTAASITDMLPGMIKKIMDTEKIVTKEIEEQGRARGGNDSKSLFDDGIKLD